MSATTTDEAATIRAAYKALGWSNRKISVKADYFSLGSSIDVTIKDASIPFAKAKEIAERAERISRCELTGEILSGGNRYVDVCYSSRARQDLAKPYVEMVAAACEKIELDDNTSCKTVVDGVMVSRSQKGIDTMQILAKNTVVQCFHNDESGHLIAAVVVGQIIAEG